VFCKEGACRILSQSLLCTQVNIVLGSIAMVDNDQDELIEYSNEEEDGFRSEYGGNTIEFGWSDERKVSGRRKKTQKKAKLGTFGAYISYNTWIK